MIKLVTVIGARPQFIKAAAISRAVRNHFGRQIHEVIVHTGQHYDENMAKVFFEELEIPKEKYNLGIGSGSHAAQTANMMIALEEVVLKESPDALLLYGDTNSTLAACLVAIKLFIPIIHVEAGVRSYNKIYPEEINRLICDHFSSLLFVPSDAGMRSLQKEGFLIENHKNVRANPDHPRIFRCGDIMYDNTLFFLNKVKKEDVFRKYGISDSPYILATMHRPSNVDSPETLESILKAFVAIGQKHNRNIILPLHPRTRQKYSGIPGLQELISNSRVYITEPVSFLDMIVLEKDADLVITDSGGVQKEAYFVKKPCLIMLDETPWPELVESGNALLTGSDYARICAGADHFLNGNNKLNFPLLYGDGKASEFICKEIINTFNP
jgi:UDP-GlcNAc3NAcA epimerase